jgi:hypothetical protein
MPESSYWPPRSMRFFATRPSRCRDVVNIVITWTETGLDDPSTAIVDPP